MLIISIYLLSITFVKTNGVYIVQEFLIIARLLEQNEKDKEKNNIAES